MNKIRMKTFTGLTFIVLFLTFIIQPWSCRTQRLPGDYPTDTIITNKNGQGWNLSIEFMRGEKHNHPLMAIWITDTTNNYIETLYLAESIAKGVYSHGDKSTGKWMPGPIRRPATLPVWAHSRNFKESDGLYIPTKNTPIPDAISGATPQNNFILQTKTSSTEPGVFRVYFEINQTWDWNEYWTNNKFPDDKEYKTSCQPALVYMATIDTQRNEGPVNLILIGHSHYNGSDGTINPDLSTITTAKQITSSIKVNLIKR